MVVRIKGGITVAKLIPLKEEHALIFGFMAGSLGVKDDITQLIDEEWHAENESDSSWES